MSRKSHEPFEMLRERTLGPNDAHRVLGQGSGRRETVCPAGLYARVSTHDQQIACKTVLPRRVQRDHARLRISFD
jgi:hypothetical protein